MTIHEIPHLFLLSDHSKDAPFTSSDEFPSIVAGSAFIVPSSTLQKVEPPSIDRQGLQSNVSASIGRTAYLRCKVKNLGHKSVRTSMLAMTTRENNFTIFHHPFKIYGLAKKISTFKPQCFSMHKKICDFLSWFRVDFGGLDIDMWFLNWSRINFW